VTAIAGKVALVTGASSGIGLAVARRLAGEGAKVALVARTAAALEDAARAIGADRAAAFPCDVKDFAALDALPAKVTARFGALDILINNAGLNHRGPIADHSAAELADVITTNLTAPIYLTRAALEHLRPGGAVVNVASLAGMIPVEHEAAYSASKAGLRAFTRALREELGARGVTVSSVCPGPVDTGFFGDVEKVPDLVFSQKMSSADEVADAVLACLRDGTAEVALPPSAAPLLAAGYVFPWLTRALKPLMQRRGAARKRRYIESKR
jgi:short-subunit dehydrogenase